MSTIHYSGEYMARVCARCEKRRGRHVDNGYCRGGSESRFVDRELVDTIDKFIELGDEEAFLQVANYIIDRNKLNA